MIRSMAVPVSWGCWECAFRVRDQFISVSSGCLVHGKMRFMRTEERECERVAVDVKVQVGSIRRALSGACSRVAYLSRDETFQGLTGVTITGIWLNHPVNVRESLKIFCPRREGRDDVHSAGRREVVCIFVVSKRSGRVQHVEPALVDGFRFRFLANLGGSDP